MAAEALGRMQAGDPVMHSMIVKSKFGEAVQNPLVSIVRKHAGDVVRFAAEFGLTPAARSRHQRWHSWRQFAEQVCRTPRRLSERLTAGAALWR